MSYRRRKRKIRYIPKNKKNIWVKSNKRGIVVVEKFGFDEVLVSNAPNEMHIDAFFRWIKTLANQLGIKISDNPEEY